MDNNATRQHLNTAACRLSLTWCDAAVEARGLLARLSAYAPGPGAVCAECAWDALVYEALEVAHPCRGTQRAAPTAAPASLGALAASLLATQCAQLLRGEMDRAPVGREVVVDSAWLKTYVTTLRPRTDCRFDHARWAVESLPWGPEDLTFEQAFALAGHPADRADAGLRLEPARFVRRLRCGRCGFARALLHLAGRLTARQRRCPECGDALVAAGVDTAEWLYGADLPPGAWRQTLARAGLRRSDVFIIATPQGRRHFGLAPALPAAGQSGAAA